MKKIKLLKEIKNYLLAFILPFVICLIIFYFKGILQDVESIYVSDLRVQHIGFLNYFKNVLMGDASIFYSFYAGMGNSMISAIIFYCISPINVLLLLVKDIRYAILFIYMVKIGLSGFTMFLFLKNKMNHNNFITVLFSTCYAFGAFVVNYFYCGFWFDSLYLAPLVMLGIDKIFKYEKFNLLYIFSLVFAIICNIQMGFGLCVFALIYYIYSYNIQYSIKTDLKKFKQLGIIFVISSLCAGAISSGALLGFGVEYQNLSASRNIQLTTSAGTSNLGYILKNFFTVGNLTENYYYNFEPFIYCGLIVSFFSILYLFDKDMNAKKRFHAFVVILIFILSFCIKSLNLFWHLSSPVLLNYRYSGYLSLFLTMLAYEGYVTKKKLSKNDIILLSILLSIGFFMIIGFSNEVYVIWTFVFLILIFIFVLLTKNKTKKFEIVLSILVLFEVFMNGYLSIYTANQLPFSKDTSYDSFKELVSYNDFDDNYRVIYNYSYTDLINDSLLLNENSSLRYFSSVINGNVVNFFNRNLSSVGNNNYRVSAYDTPLLLSLIGAKHLYLTEELNNSIYQKVDSYQIESYNYQTAENEVKDVYLYDNPYALSLGYIIEGDFNYEEGMDLVDYQNGIIKAFTGSEKDVLIRLNHSLSSNSERCVTSDFVSCKTYEVTNHTNNVHVYVYSLFDRYTLENSNSKQYLDINKPFLISTIDRNITLTLESNNYVSDEEFAAVTYDESNLIDNLNVLHENMLNDIEIDKNVLTGKIHSSKNGILFLSIPYDDDFEIYVDGEVVDYYALLDNTFIGLDMEEGEHDIKIKYVSKNYIWYLIATLSSIIVTLVLYFIMNRSIEKRKEKERLEEARLRELKTKRKNGKKRK